MHARAAARRNARRSYRGGPGISVKCGVFTYNEASLGRGQLGALGGPGIGTFAPPVTGGAMTAIPEACAVLTSFRHCQQQAVAFRRCTEAKGAAACHFESGAFQACADDSLEQVSLSIQATFRSISILHLGGWVSGLQRAASASSPRSTPPLGESHSI